MIDCPFEEVLLAIEHKARLRTSARSYLPLDGRLMLTTDIIGEYTAAVYSQRFFFIPVDIT